MIAEVADHYLITPPARLLGDARQTIDWVKTIDYTEIDGAIISLDAVSGSGEEPPEVIKYLRSHRPGIRIYGFVTLAESSAPQIERALESLAGGGLDFLLIGTAFGQGNQGRPATDRPASLLAKLKSEVESRRLGARVRFTDDLNTGAISLLARMVNRRFGFAPRVLPVYSSKSGSEVVPTGYSARLSGLTSDQIKDSGGIELQQTADGARNVDLLIFVQTPQTRDSERAALVETIAQTIDRNIRIAFVDLSGTKEPRDAVANELRRRKLLDRLVSYAAWDPTLESPGDAVARSLGQSLAFLASIRFLRDDLDRVRRFDRAQEALLLSRYLSDWLFPSQLRPNLPSFLIDRGVKSEAIESDLFTQLKPLAEELFADQFKRNVHAFLLSQGERAEFEVRLIQRLMIRLFWPPGTSPSGGRLVELDVKPSVHLVHLGNAPVPNSRSQKLWEIRGEVDDRVGRRWEDVYWPGFKTDAESVEMTIKVAAKQDPPAGAPENYQISSKRSRNVRRIEIEAPSPQSAFYAIGKLERMGADGQLAQDFQINERPSSAQRGMIESFSGSWWSHADRLEMLGFLGRLRMNRYYYVPEPVAAPNAEQREREERQLAELLRVADENFVQMVYGIRLASNGQDLASIESLLDRLTRLGIRRFVLCFPRLSDEMPGGQEEDRWKKTLSEQSVLIGRLHEYLKRSGEYELSVWPGSKAGSKFAADYLKGLAAAIPPGVKILTPFGASELRAIEPSRLVELQPINREGARGQLLDLCLSPRFADLSSAGAANGKAADWVLLAAPQLQVTKLLLATLSEQVWDGRGYNRDWALLSAMNLLYDERSRAGVRVWSGLIGDCRSRENRTPPDLNQLRAGIEAISGTRAQGLLRGEFDRFVREFQE